MAVNLEPHSCGGVSMAPLRLSEHASYEHEAPAPKARPAKRKAKTTEVAV